VRLYDPAIEAIEAMGGRVVFGSRVERADGDSVTLADGAVLRAGSIVSALPLEKAIEVVQGASADARLRTLLEEGFSPILGVHLELDRPLLEVPHAVLVDRATQWLFRKSSDGRRVQAVISGADAWMEMDEPEIVTRIMDDVRACIPGGAAARVLRARPVKERRATFAATPRFELARPMPGSRIGGVFLAGDYTSTGWPATMEGAVRSGAAAAAGVLTELGAGCPSVGSRLGSRS
jgi:predicted NAD/FAD-dependent oxidoreductase